jgi:predicted regulator of Ras-like GTPase activity (Roadblock/LC7/MglB family)
MVNKKQVAQKTESLVVVENQPAVPIEVSLFKNLSENLKKIRSLEGILGYIIRNGISAEIDLQEPEKLVEYAIFTSQIVDSSQELAELFTLGSLKTMLVEGAEFKVLILIINENKINIFMKNNIDHIKIAEKISP